MARYGQPSELLGAMLWLASDSASFVTGAEIAALAIGLSIFVIITGIFFGLFYSDNKNVLERFDYKYL